MKFDIKALALTCGVFCVVLFLFCAFFIWIAPDFVFSVLNLLFHGIDLKPIYNPSINLNELIGGALLIFFASVIGAAIWGWLYNQLERE